MRCQLRQDMSGHCLPAADRSGEYKCRLSPAAGITARYASTSVANRGTKSRQASLWQIAELNDKGHLCVSSFMDAQIGCKDFPRAPCDFVSVRDTPHTPEDRHKFLFCRVRPPIRARHYRALTATRSCDSPSVVRRKRWPGSVTERRCQPCGARLLKS